MLRERQVKSNGVIVEAVSVRKRLPSESSRFGNYERVSETTIVSTEPAGAKVTTSNKDVERRNPNGQLQTTESSATTVITVPKR